MTHVCPTYNLCYRLNVFLLVLCVCWIFYRDKIICDGYLPMRYG